MVSDLIGYNEKVNIKPTVLTGGKLIETNEDWIEVVTYTVDTLYGYLLTNELDSNSILTSTQEDEIQELMGSVLEYADNVLFEYGLTDTTLAPGSNFNNYDKFLVGISIPPDTSDLDSILAYNNDLADIMDCAWRAIVAAVGIGAVYDSWTAILSGSVGVGVRKLVWWFIKRYVGYAAAKTGLISFGDCLLDL